MTFLGSVDLRDVDGTGGRDGDGAVELGLSFCLSLSSDFEVAVVEVFEDFFGAIFDREGWERCANDLGDGRGATWAYAG